MDSMEVMKINNKNQKLIFLNGSQQISQITEQHG